MIINAYFSYLSKYWEIWRPYRNVQNLLHSSSRISAFVLWKTSNQPFFQLQLHHAPIPEMCVWACHAQICASIFCSKNAAGPRSLMISHLSSMKPPSTSNFLPFADANSWGNHGISTVGICGPYGETWRFGTLNARLLQLPKASSAKMNCQT